MSFSKDDNFIFCILRGNHIAAFDMVKKEWISYFKKYANRIQSIFSGVILQFSGIRTDFRNKNIFYLYNNESIIKIDISRVFKINSRILINK